MSSTGPRGNRWRSLLLACGGVAAAALAAGDGPLPEGALQPLSDAYLAEVRPLMERYCHDCHNADLAEAEIDLTRFAALADVRQDARTWARVGEMLDSGQMPPEDGEQPSDQQRERIQTWVHDFRMVEARAHAGDPGRVVLRRLSNAEYTYTIRDLTGVDSLDPAREFPVDGAAGEGFTNTGGALVMSPSLVTKYLDAAKEIASHAVLVPDGIRFSPHTSSRDWTDETLAEIRAFYAEFSKTGASDPLILQGVPIDSPERGQLPLEKYLAVTLTARERLSAGETTIEDVARESTLNARYLAALWDALTGAEPSLVLDGLRARWRTATPADAASLAAYVEQWQKALWKFNSIGHIGAVGAPSRWQEAVDPLVAEQEIRYSIPAAADGGEVTLSLVASDAGDGAEHDVVVWHNPRLAAPGRPDLPLREVRRITQELTALRERVFSQTAACLKAVTDAVAAEGGVDVPELARRHSIDVESLQAWLDLLGVGIGSPVELEGHFTSQLRGVGGHEFVNGWGADATPLVLANSSDEPVRVPGAVKPHGIVVHPSPTMGAAAAWRSPIGGAVRIEAAVSHAHPECGNGVTWTLELRRGTTRRRLAAGVAQGAAAPVIDPLDGVGVQPGDVVMLLIAARDGDHSCDLTAVDLKITDGSGQVWDLANELSGDVLAANPRADRFGNDAVWHLLVQPEEPGTTAPVIPAGSLLAQWQSAATAEEKNRLAAALQQLLTDGVPAGDESADAALYRELASLRGPLFQQGMAEAIADVNLNTAFDADADTAGLDPAMFGKHPEGGEIDSNSLCVRAPSVITVRLPAELAAGCELVATGRLDGTVGAEGSVQLRVVPGAPASADGLLAGEVQLTDVAGMWTSDNRLLSHSAPIVVADGSAARRRLESAFDDFRAIFPAALCYTKIVPIDEVVTLTLLYREDDHLVRLMLDERQRERLDRLWAELRFVSRDPLKMVDALEQLIEFATQDADPSKLEPLRQPTAQRAAFQQALVDAEPKQVAALLEFAAKAWRRPLTAAETRDLRELYIALRAEELPHDEALRLTLARVLVAPAFLYRVETPPPGEKPGAVADGELAARLSYFLWSSLPDDELRQVTAAGRLRDPDILLGQTRRMLRDAKTRRLAIEFGCQWLAIKDFDRLDEKSERHFPTFVSLRGAMYEESVQFFADLFQNNRSVLDILDADYTFLNQELASHYGIPGVSGPEWRRVDGVKQFSRGGVLAQATTLATQAGASRTSPILRGNWISEVLVGQKLPRPPKGVPPLPDDGGVAEGLTVRQLVEKHVSDPKCAVCHRRIDPFGFSLEAFDAIGRYRETDAGNLPIDAHVKTADGAEFTGLDGLRSYLLTDRRDDFVRQFCRKLLGYALGRGVELSDEGLLEAMQSQLAANNYEVVSAVEAIVTSPQFREIRGRDRVDEAAAGDLHVKDEP